MAKYEICDVGILRHDACQPMNKLEDSMASFWFICFAIAFLYSIFARKKISQNGERILKIEARETECTKADARANDTLEHAQILRREAASEVKHAEKLVLEVESKNKVLNLAIEEVVNLWINDSFKSISDRLKAENYATQKNRMEKVFETCRKLGIDFDGRQERAFYVRLENNWKEEVVLQKAKDEQARIKEIMREEQRAEKARAAELKKLEQETKELEKKQRETEERLKVLHELEKLKQLTSEQERELQQATAANNDLAKQLQEKERRKSMAELTKAGHVYVISNVGSFGDDVFKVGMTRRLIPEERVKELGDASVPFPFDIHLLIATENAPALESTLHEALWKRRLNLVNDRREFFRADLKEIKELVDKHGGTVAYEFKEAAEASQWRESESRRQQGQFGSYDGAEPVGDEGDEEDAA
jgi:hypothetical protein